MRSAHDRRALLHLIPRRLARARAYPFVTHHDLRLLPSVATTTPLNPLELPPFTLQTLVSPVFPFHSSTTDSSPSSSNDSTTRPISPSSSPQKSRISQLLSDVTSGSTPSSTAMDHDASSSSKLSTTVRSVDAEDDQVWVGGSDGRIRIYQVGDGPLPNWSALSPSATTIKKSGGTDKLEESSAVQGEVTIYGTANPSCTRTDPVLYQQDMTLELVQEVYTSTRKAPDRIALLPRLNKAAMLVGE